MKSGEWRTSTTPTLRFGARGTMQINFTTKEKETKKKKEKTNRENMFAQRFPVDFRTRS